MAIIYTWSLDPDEFRREVSKNSAVYATINAYKVVGYSDSDVAIVIDKKD